MQDGANIIIPNEVGHKVVLLLEVESPLLLDLVEPDGDLLYPVLYCTVSCIVLYCTVPDGDVLVPVLAGVLMPEPHSVHQLVDHTEHLTLQSSDISHESLGLYPF